MAQTLARVSREQKILLKSKLIVNGTTEGQQCEESFGGRNEKQCHAESINISFVLFFFCWLVCGMTKKQIVPTYGNATVQFAPKTESKQNIPVPTVSSLSLSLPLLAGTKELSVGQYEKQHRNKTREARILPTQQFGDANTLTVEAIIYIRAPSTPAVCSLKQQ